MLDYVIIALGVGLVICSFFIGWKPPGWAALGAGIGAISAGLGYLWGL